MIKLILLAVVLASIIWLGACRAGKKQLEKDYTQDYDKLARDVNDFKVCRRNYIALRRRFAEIRRYACRDKERIDVLNRQFKKRFHEIHSSNN